MQPSINHILGRISHLRSRLEVERRGTGAPPTRALRLKALLLRSQKHLADLIEPAPPRVVPVRAIAIGSHPVPGNWR